MESASRSVDVRVRGDVVGTVRSAAVEPCPESYQSKRSYKDFAAIGFPQSSRSKPNRRSGRAKKLV